jgi:integrase
MSAPKLKQSDDGVFYVHWTEGRRSKRVSTRTKDLAAAKVFLGQWLLMEQEGPAPGNLTCEEIWAVYEKRRFPKMVDTVSPKRCWKNLERYFGTMSPKSVSASDIETYTHKRLTGSIGYKSSTTTVALELRYLVASWNFAVKKRVLLSTALPDLEELDLPESGKGRTRWLRDEEIDRLFAAAAALRVGNRLSRVERFMWIALETGSRRRAIEELRWDQVDFETRVINFLPEGREQTTKRRAAVAISDALLPVLRRAWDERTTEFVLDSPRKIYEALGPVKTAANLEDIHPHVFRHTAATIMLRNGVSLFLVAKTLGNTVEVVQSVYGHHMPEDTRDPVNTISRARLRCVS